MRRFIIAFFRVLIPVGIIAAGGYAFTLLSVEPEETKSAPVAKQVIRTKVTRLHVGEYSVVVTTNGVVQPHNQVTLSAEVSGEITVLNPEFEVGSYFSEGDVLIELDDRDYQTALTVAKAGRRLAESALKLAETSHERMLQLSRGNSASKLELDQAVAALAQARAEVDIATSRIEQAERDLQRTKIVAAFDGRVQQKAVGIGQLVSPGTALGDVFAVDYAEVRLPIAGRELRFLDLPEMADDLPVSVELRDAIDSSSDIVWNAKIVRTEGALDKDSLELFAIARINDPFGLHSNRPVLRIGQPVVAAIAGEVLTDVVVMPRGAVRQLDQVYLVDEAEMTLMSLSIQPIWSDEDFVIVSDPSLSDGVLLATTQLVYAPEGGKVEIIPDAETVDSVAAAEATEE
ncbi:MAG TPA: efflux RND transporter periplasmic adaptor subunit [Planctomycetes bacterium]|nr:efflux RND transporter periplasmic adaptor subunit [Planctomycetota bacterium]